MCHWSLSRTPQPLSAPIHSMPLGTVELAALPTYSPRHRTYLQYPRSTQGGAPNPAVPAALQVWTIELLALPDLVDALATLGFRCAPSHAPATPAVNTER